MRIVISENALTLGVAAGVHAARLINHAIAEHGSARIVLSTGASQFDTLSVLVRQKVDWSKVEMFHLDEYVGLPETHPASFRRYLTERFVSKVPLKAAHFVDGTAEGIPALTKELLSAPIDVGLIGIGENGHIAFNDPPADFDTDESYIVVDLDERCRQQQVGEGWFKSIDKVPAQAISMTPKRIMACRTIISCVPYAVKAEAVRKTLLNDTTNLVPATLLKQHPAYTLYLDKESASEVTLDDVALANPTLEAWESYETV